MDGAFGRIIRRLFGTAPRAADAAPPSVRPRRRDAAPARAQTGPVVAPIGAWTMRQDPLRPYPADIEGGDLLRPEFADPGTEPDEHPDDDWFATRAFEVEPIEPSGVPRGLTDETWAPNFGDDLLDTLDRPHPTSADGPILPDNEEALAERASTMHASAMSAEEEDARPPFLDDIDLEAYVAAEIPNIDGDPEAEAPEEWLEDVEEEAGPSLPVPHDDVFPALPEWFEETSPDDARPDPADQVPADDAASDRAASRAATLALDLELPLRTQQRAAALWLEELLTEFPHGASHSAIARLVRSGLVYDDIQAAARLVRWWRADPTLWLARHFDRRERRWQIRSDRKRGAHALGWSAAARLVRRFDIDNIEARLMPWWRDLWLHLEADHPAFPSFAAFVATRADLRSDSMPPDSMPFDSWQTPLDGTLLDETGDRAASHGWIRELDPAIARLIRPDGRPTYPWPDIGALSPSVRARKDEA